MRPFILEVCYLTGRCVATAYHDRERSEWPLHPARLYSALVATWAESEECDPAERAALEWLAGLEAPCIHASAASPRQAVPHFVPVNDAAVLTTFEREREKLLDCDQALESAKAEYESAQRAGDKKALEKASKALAKAEKVRGAEHRKFEQLLATDQEPYARGKHPASALKSAHALIPDNRSKQPRTFPSVSPDDPRVFLRWTGRDEEIERHTSALAGLAGRVVRIGHSASLVACSVAKDSPPPTLEPSDSGNEVLRVPGPGQLERLVDAFALHQEVEPRVLPCRFQRYKSVGERPEDPQGESVFGEDWVVFRQVHGRRLSQTCGVEMAKAMRGALMKHASDPPPELLSGHAESGEPSNKPHLAVVPLPFVGHPHATGELLGLALVFPRAADDTARREVLRAVGVWEDQRRAEEDDEEVQTPSLQLVLGRAGALELERVEWGVAALKTLRGATWCQASRAWVTATPIALDRNPGNLSSPDPVEQAAAFAAAESSIATACERIGLPRPHYVQVHSSVPLHAAVKAREYPSFPADPQKHQRVKVHARLEFPIPVRGPVLLGAGRYYGLGLCVPQPREARIQT